MKLESDLIEATHADMMRRMLEPADDGIPDPGIDFSACLSALLERIEMAVYSLPRAERAAYFREKARGALEWCRKVRAPDVLTERVRAWAERLERGPA